MLAIALSVLVAQAGPAAEPSVSVGVSLPWIFFPSATEQAGFLSDLEAKLGEAIGRKVAASISAPVGLKNYDLWLVDATIGARSDGKVLAQGRAGGASYRSVALYTTTQGGAAFDVLSRNKVAVPGGSAQDRSAVRYWLLLDEPGSGDIAKRLTAARDSRTALTNAASNAVQGALGFKSDYSQRDKTLAGLKELVTLREMPLPVLLASKRAAGAVVEAFTKAQAHKKLPPIPGIVDGWSNDAGDSYSLLASTLRRSASPVSRAPVLATAPRLTLDLTALLPAAPVTELEPSLFMPVPADDALPDPPEPAEKAPVASR